LVYELGGKLHCPWCKQEYPLDSPWKLVNEHDRSHRKYYDMIDCIQFECQDNQCSFKGKVASADICKDEATLLIRFHDDLYPMCEHTWDKAKEYLDSGLEEAKRWMSARTQHS
jgi:hypothetical protein